MEVDFTKPLLRLDGEWQRVEYDTKICFKCGRFGHNSLFCTFVPSEENRESTPASEHTPPQQTGGCSAEAEVEGADFGPWMHSQRRARRSTKKESSNSVGKSGDGKSTAVNQGENRESRFNVLSNLPDSEGRRH